jgi:RNA polymerase sigma-70 factor (ECF subfamily)
MKKSKKEMTLQEMGMQFFITRKEADFVQIYKRLKPSISFYLRELVPQYDDRNDVIATTFLKIFTKIEQYNPAWNFSTWAYRIARNEALLFHRAKRKTFSYEAMIEEGNIKNSIEKKLIKDSDLYEFEFELFEEDPIVLLYDQAISEINKLPDIYKKVLTLREIQKKKYEEIAKELGWNHNTVRTRIRKGRELVRSNLLKKNPTLVKKYQTINMI